MGADREIQIRTPIFYGTERERLIQGESKLTLPFVELWSEWRPEVHFGLREPRSDIQYYGNNNFTEPDPVILFRALKMLDCLNEIDPHLDLRDVCFAAGVTGNLRLDRYARNRIVGLIGKEAFKEASQATPPNLSEVISRMKQEKLAVDGTTLEREIKRGMIPSQPLYERVIGETKRRQAKMAKEMEKYQNAKYALT
ncbi:hypothetical protein HYU95_05360 [Candidatus Daviesbacteria bacterium]|nr:hypothetical protein [Candidatus Daviesbacteria bacterium]